MREEDRFGVSLTVACVLMIIVMGVFGKAFATVKSRQAVYTPEGSKECIEADDSAEERAFFFAEKGDTIYYSNRIVKIAFKQD